MFREPLADNAAPPFLNRAEATCTTPPFAAKSTRSWCRLGHARGDTARIPRARRGNTRRFVRATNSRFAR